MVVANTGTWTYRIGQSWLVLALTGDPMLLGLVTACQFLPMLIVGPWAGVLAERRDKRLLLMSTQSALMLQAAALGAATLAGLASAPVLLAAAAILGIITALDGPARASIVTDLVPPGLVVNAVSLNSASLNVARLLGPAVAGLVIAAAGSGWVFWISAGAFAFMVICLTGLRPAPSAAPRRSGGVRDGVRHVRSHPDLLFVVATAGLVAMLVLNFQMTTAVMTAQEFHTGPEVYGALGSVMAIGSLAASLAAARRGSTDVRTVAAAALLLAASAVLAGLAPEPWTFGAALIACGVSALTMMTSANSYLQLNAGEEHRSRVMALYLAVFFGTTPFGAPLVGWLVASFGPRAGLVIPGAVSLVAVVGLIAMFRGRLELAVPRPRRRTRPA